MGIKRNINIKCYKTRKHLNFSFYNFLLKSKYNIKFAFYIYIYNYKAIIGSILFFLIIIGFSLSTNWFNNILTTEATNFFTSLGTLVGGSLAIVFTIRILLIQNASAYLSSGFYEVAIKDKVYSTLFWLIVFLTFVFFGLALFFTNVKLLVEPNNLDNIGRISIIVTGFVFWSIYIMFKRIQQRINPSSNLEYIKKNVYKLLKSWDKQSLERAKIILKHPIYSKNISYNTALAASQGLLRPLIQEINDRIDYLFDFHDKLVSFQEGKAARKVLSTIEDIVLEYIKYRGNTSYIIKKEGEFIGMTDSLNFVLPIIQGYLQRARFYIDHQNDVGSTHVVTILKKIALSSKNMQHVEGNTFDLTFFSLTMNQMCELLIYSIDKHSNDAIFEITKAFETIGSAAIAKHDITVSHPIIDTLDLVAEYSLKNQKNHIFGAVVKSYTILLSESIKNNFYEHTINKILDKYSKIFVRYLLFEDFYRESLYMLMAINSIFDEISKDMNLLYQKANIEDDKNKIKTTQSHVIILLEECRRFLRRLSEQIKSTDNSLIFNISKFISNILILTLTILQNSKWMDQHEKINELIKWYIHQPFWFVRHSEKIHSNQSLDSLIETIAKFGIIASTSENDFLLESIKSICSIAIQVIEKEVGSSFGFTEPRIMEKACYLGLLAFKKRNKNIVQQLKVKISEFQTQYEKKWFAEPMDEKITSPRKNQLKQELINLKQEIIKLREDSISPNVNSRTLIAKLITDNDIDSFIKEIWK